MSNNKRQRQQALEARTRAKLKDRGIVDNEVAGFGSMQKPKVNDGKVEGNSLYSKNPEEIVVGGRRMDWDPSRSR